MTLSYFDRITELTPTKFWVNNPSRAETDLAIANHAISCTTNPSHCSKLLESDPTFLQGIIDEVVRQEEDDNIAADLVYQRAAAWIMQRFRPMFDRSGGTRGFVTIQADPSEDDETDLIIEAALRHRKLGPNYMAKIPVISSGIEAIEAMVAEDIPVCATEVFSLAQAFTICERWENAVKKYGKRPPFFLTHIAGIFDQYLAGFVKANGIPIAPEVLAQAGCTVGRKEYHLVRARGFRTQLLGGGARGIQHWTEFVGGDMHITINWSTAQELIDKDPAIVSRIDVPTPLEIVQELEQKVPDFRRAYREDGLTVEEYKGFGPVQLFRNMFLSGYGKLLDEVKAHR